MQKKNLCKWVTKFLNIPFLDFWLALMEGLDSLY